MKKNTVTEKYIDKAVEAVKDEFAGTRVENCSITMRMEADGATETLTGVLNLVRAEGYTRCRWAVRKGGVWTVGVIK